MRIIIDAMGGDNAPAAVIEGANIAKAEYGGKFEMTLVGDESAIKKAASEGGFSLDGIDIYHTDVKIEMDDDPMNAVRKKKESSMAIGLKMLSPENKYGVVGDAFLSAGSTGALHLASSHFVGRLMGVRRACLATYLPFPNHILLLDSGANPTVTADQLLSWAYLGSVYAESVLGMKNPRVGLINNGTEECKGTEMYIEAHKLLAASDLNFAGNVESREIPFGACDVLVCDGFTGNITLKLIEGMASFFMKSLKDIYKSSTVASLSYLPVRSKFGTLKKSFDASEHGGAPILGLKAPVIKGHGNSNGRAVFTAIRQAYTCVESEMTAKMSENLKKTGNGND